MIVEGNLVDIHQKSIYPARITLEGERIQSIQPLNATNNSQYILPGFIDAHIHIESSMLPPAEFARWAVRHGTVGTVSDPHEIANVLGKEGVQFMLDSAALVPFNFFFGAPSCVPATPFETAGAELNVEDVKALLNRPDIFYLSEMMNWPGAINGDKDVLAKIKAAQSIGKPVDGHAPGLTGDQAKAYFSRGISTDHECYTYNEALEKLKLGVAIQIREGSAAKNYEALHPLIDEYAHQMMFCSDDKHPDDLVEGHINQLIARAIRDQHNLFDVLTMACKNPVEHYKLPVGLLREGDPADFIVCENLESFQVKATYIKGICVAEHGKATFERKEPNTPNQFRCDPIAPEVLEIPFEHQHQRVIQAHDGLLTTSEKTVRITSESEFIETDIKNDRLKIAVVNRYHNTPPAIAWVTGTGLKAGAFASSVAHDSHNIIAIGTHDNDLAEAINLVINEKGGLSFANGSYRKTLPLPIAGIMSNLDGNTVAKRYEELSQQCKAAGCQLKAPYMTLSFLALLVIPELKLSDKGLFNGQSFQFVPLQFT